MSSGLTLTSIGSLILCSLWLTTTLLLLFPLSLFPSLFLLLLPNLIYIFSAEQTGREQSFGEIIVATTTQVLQLLDVGVLAGILCLLSFSPFFTTLLSAIFASLLSRAVLSGFVIVLSFYSFTSFSTPVLIGSVICLLLSAIIGLRLTSLSIVAIVVIVAVISATDVLFVGTKSIS